MMLQKPTPGMPASKTPLASSAFVSDLMDIRNAYLPLGDAPPPTTLANPTDLVKVKNLTGANRVQGAVVQLGDDLLNDIDFRNLWFEADLVAHPACTRYAILREPIKSNDIGWAQVSGVCVARVNVTDTDHLWAIPAVGSAVLKSSPLGPIEILSPLTSTGEQDAIVRMSVDSEVTIGVTATSGVYPSSGDTFEFDFVRGSFPDSTGNLTPSYDVLAISPKPFVHNLAGEHIPQGTHIIIVRHNEEYWTHYKSGTSNELFRGKFSGMKPYGVNGTGQIVTWNGTAYVGSGVEEIFIDPFGVWPRAELGWYCWLVLTEDRSYEIVWCQGWPRFVEALLYENMGATTSQQAQATVFKAYGNADHGGQPDTWLLAELITLYDTRNRWPWAKQNDYAYAIYEEEFHKYHIVDLPETVGGGSLYSPSPYTASAEARITLGGTPIITQRNCVSDTVVSELRPLVAGYWEFHLCGVLVGSNTTAVTQTGNVAVLKIVRLRGAAVLLGLNVAVARASPMRLNSVHANVPFACVGQRDDVLLGDKFIVTCTCGENLTFGEMAFTAHLIQPDTIGRPAPPVAPLMAALQEMQRNEAAEQASTIAQANTYYYSGV